jgi:ketosteroid isomerase-like protein
MDPGRLSGGLERQFIRAAAAWNRGDLDEFMQDYAPGSEPTFVAEGHLQRGFAYIRGRYAPLFAPGAQRDSLRFEEFNVRPLTDEYALVTARYILFRNGQITASGPFTLLMHRRQEGWKILHDHSSSD